VLAAGAVAPIPAGAGVSGVVGGEGIATLYESNDGGNCMMPGPPADRLDAALSHDEYGTADACGGYLDVTGPRGTVRVLITNQCPECPVGHVDLSSTAFARIADPVAGRVPVTYSLVRDPPVAQPIAIRVKDGSSRWWMQIQALDHGNPLATFELQTPQGWRSLTRTAHNYWTAENPGPGDGPFTVRVTDIHGQSATIDGIALAPEQVQRTGARLYGEGAGGGSAAPPATPTEPPPDATATDHATTRARPVGAADHARRSRLGPPATGRRAPAGGLAGGIASRRRGTSVRRAGRRRGHRRRRHGRRGRGAPPAASGAGSGDQVVLEPGDPQAGSLGLLGEHPQRVAQPVLEVEQHDVARPELGHGAVPDPAVVDHDLPQDDGDHAAVGGGPGRVGVVVAVGRAEQRRVSPERARDGLGVAADLPALAGERQRAQVGVGPGVRLDDRPGQAGEVVGPGRDRPVHEEQ
jgi:expansin